MCVVVFGGEDGDCTHVSMLWDWTAADWDGYVGEPGGNSSALSAVYLHGSGTNV